MPESLIRSFDPQSINFIFGGIPITGYAPGTFLTLEPTADAWTTVTGPDGFNERVKSNDYSMIVRVVLLKTSPSNDVFSTFYNADKLSNAGVVPCMIRDQLGTTVGAAASAYIARLPDLTYSDSAGDANREWVIHAMNMELFVGGSTPYGE